ncbi:MAG: hypothetical protein GY805_32260 [Chloroflexi bacterium]|nr:hypothetical protein [Chloroflexota bacterium]
MLANIFSLFFLIPLKLHNLSIAILLNNHKSADLFGASVLLALPASYGRFPTKHLLKNGRLQSTIIQETLCSCFWLP